jgi:hypothetical protein
MLMRPALLKLCEPSDCLVDGMHNLVLRIQG